MWQKSIFKLLVLIAGEKEEDNLGTTSSSAFNFDLSSPPTTFKKKKLVRVWCRAVKMFKDL